MDYLSLSNKTSRFYFFFYTDSSTMYHLKWWKLLQGLQNTRFLVMTFSFLHKLITLIALFCSLFCLQICKIFPVSWFTNSARLHCRASTTIKHTIIFIGVSTKQLYSCNVCTLMLLTRMIISAKATTFFVSVAFLWHAYLVFFKRLQKWV